MADYILKGVDPDQWKRFKSLCSIRDCTIKESFIQHINFIIGGYAVLTKTPYKPHTAPKQRRKKK